MGFRPLPLAPARATTRAALTRAGGGPLTWTAARTCSTPANTFNNPWYGRLFTDPDFWQRWIDRYQELRKTVYSLTNLMARIDHFGDEVREATAREYARWAGRGLRIPLPASGAVTGDGLTYTFPTPGTWQGEMEFHEVVVLQPGRFHGRQFPESPGLQHQWRPDPAGFTLTITAPTVRPTRRSITRWMAPTRVCRAAALTRRPSPALNTATVTLIQQRPRLCPQLECQPSEPHRREQSAHLQFLVRADRGDVLHRHAAFANHRADVQSAPAARRQHE